MRIQHLDIPDADTWAKDCKLLSVSDSPLPNQGFRINYHREKDDTYWNIRFNGIAAYKVIPKELSRTGYLINLPTEGALYEIFGSPWLKELGKDEDEFSILKNYNHFVLQFQAEVIEILTANLIFEKLKEKPAVVRNDN